MSQTNGIHETAQPGAASTVTLLGAGSGRAERTFATWFATNEPLQYSMRSTTTDKAESGHGYLDSTGKLVRALVIEDYDGTTQRKFPSTLLDFGSETADVWCAPAPYGVPDAFVWGQYPGSPGNIYERGVVGWSDAGSTHTIPKGRLVLMPFLKESANRVKGLQWYQNAAADAGTGPELYFCKPRSDGGIALLGTVTGSAGSGAGAHAQAFDGSVVIDAPPGFYLLGFIWDTVTSGTVRGRENRFPRMFGATNTSGSVMAYQDFASWALGDGFPTITSLSGSTANSQTVDIMLWLDP